MVKNLRLVALPVKGILTSALLTCTAFCCQSFSDSCRAEDSQEPAAKKEEAEIDYNVPDGTPEQILEFVDQLKKAKPKITSRQEAIDHAVKLNRAFIEAGDKILSQETKDDVAANAAQLKLNSLTMLAANGIGDSTKEALAAVTKLKQDERPSVAKVADKFWPVIRIFNFSDLDEADQKSLIKEALDAVAESHFSRESVMMASQLGDVLANKGRTDEAGAIYDRLAMLAKASDDQKVQLSAERYEGTARRLRLPGHQMTLEGKTLDGHELDWAAYRGKVVLVDFWATWCGPCIAELPNVKKNYELYHDKGFDVIGISLDRAKEPLEKFVAKQDLPWTQLYDEEIQKGKGWNHPMAEYFGISGIPATILVDKEGNVVTLHARGSQLTEQLEKLLGKSE